ncbi:MAG: TIM barrel protein [Victivallales bacterium]|nr:TIM barrel protein [Victivallales bacterium]
MKFGIADYGVNVWDGGLYDIQERLEMLREIGYNGTERLEATGPADAIYKAGIYKRMGMDFSTCRGPSVQNGIEWTAALGKKYVWATVGDISRSVDFDIYCRRVNKMIDVCAKWGVRASVHNHLHQRVEQHHELVDFLEKCPGAGIVFDTGHLSAAGGDPVEIVKKYAHRIDVVHLKDVFVIDDTINAEGYKNTRFCELGAGNNGFDNLKVMAALAEAGYDGWVHIEHDTHLREPLVDLTVSYRYLVDAGYVNEK